MKVPLACYINPNNINIICNKKKISAKFPFYPTCYIKKGAQFLERGDDPVWKDYTDLWSKEKIKVYEKIFYDTTKCYKFFKENRDSGFIFSLSYFEQILIIKPDYFFSYPNTDTLTKLTFDIEVLTKGGGQFPQASKDPIIAIGYKVNDEPVKVIDCYDEKRKDYFITEEFLKVFDGIDSDLVIGYNLVGISGEGFDIPYLIERARKNRLNVNRLSRWGADPIIQRGEKEIYKFYGRCIFDVYNMVLKDDSLFGIKNRKLETVAKWYKIPIYKIPDFYTGSNKKYIQTEELRKHVSSDVNAAYELFKIYFPIQKTLAEMMGIPLDKVVNSYASFIPKIFNGKYLMKLKMIPFQSNAKRYQDTRFQAALTNLERPGLHHEVYGIDIASFYPSLMVSFNLSPESVQIIGIRNLTNDFIFKSDGETLWLQVPDNNFHYNLLLKIDLKNESFTKKEISKFFNIRNELKEKMKIAEGVQHKIFKSQSDAMKVLSNSIYGNNALVTTWLGDMGVAIAIVGLARWILGKVLKHLGNNVISFDTDGIYVRKKVDIDKINKFVTDLIYENAKVKSYIKFEDKGKYSGYFYKTKNYILKKEDGTFERHGVSMKSSRAPIFYDEIISLVAEAMLNGTEEKDLIKLSNTLYTLSQFDLSDFVQRTRMSKIYPKLAKELTEKAKGEKIYIGDVYKNPNALQPALMRRAREKFNRKLKVGDSIEYFKKPNLYVLKEEVAFKKQLDMKYYQEVADKALRIFKLDREHILDKMQGKLDFKECDE